MYLFILDAKKEQFYYALCKGQIIEIDNENLERVAISIHIKIGMSITSSHHRILCKVRLSHLRHGRASLGRPRFIEQSCISKRKAFFFAGTGPASQMCTRPSSCTPHPTPSGSSPGPCTTHTAWRSTILGCYYWGGCLYWKCNFPMNPVVRRRSVGMYMKFPKKGEESSTSISMCLQEYGYSLTSNLFPHIS